MEQRLASAADAMQYPAEEGNRTLSHETTETENGRRLRASSRHQHILPVPLVTRNPSEIKTRSDQLTSHIMRELLDGKYYNQNPASGFAEYRQLLPRGKGYISLIVSQQSDEPWERVLASLDLLGDELVDTFQVLLAVALDSNGTGHITLPFAISPNDILAICQKKKSKGSYPARQRLKVIEQVHTLARIAVQADLIQQNGKSWHVESPLLELLNNEALGGNTQWSGHESLRAWYLKIGDWAAVIPQLRSQTAVMARHVLHYHGRKQKYEKRLGRYLTLLYRINAYNHQGRVKVSMGVLLEQAGIVLDRDNPGRTRDAIENALNQLRIDGVIGAFRLLPEHVSQHQEVQERIEQHAYHWWDNYRQQLWLFELPEYLTVLYRSAHCE